MEDCPIKELNRNMGFSERISHTELNWTKIGEPLKNELEHMWGFPSAYMRSWTELDWNRTTSKKPFGAHMSFFERVDTILNWTELNRSGRTDEKRAGAHCALFKARIYNLQQYWTLNCHRPGPTSRSQPKIIIIIIIKKIWNKVVC